MRKNLILWVTFLMLFPLISAVTELTIPFNSEIDIKRPCFNNGSFCSASAVCNLTIKYPDGNLLLDDVRMTNQISVHNVTIPSQNISQFGIHPTSMVCNDGGLTAADTFDIEVTSDGFQKDVFPFQFSIILLAVVLIGASFVNDRMKIFKLLGSFLLMVMGVITLFPGYSGINYSNLPGLSLGTIIIGLGFYFLIQDAFSFDKQTDNFNQLDDGRFHD